MRILVPYCEWDINLKTAYETLEGFETAASRGLKEAGIEETLLECEDQGLIGFNWETLGE